jgi:PAS domain S-box-containing protein
MHENQLVPITRNGRRQDVYWTYSFGPIDDGTAPHQVGGVLVICTETTELVQQDRRREAELVRQRQIFQQAPGFVIVMNGPEHRVDFVNDAHQRLFGSAQWVGKSIRQAFPDIEGQGFYELLDGVFRSGQAYSAAASPANFRSSENGTWETRFLDFTYAPVLDVNGEVSGIFCMGFDVTERQRAQEELGASEEQLRLAVQAGDVGLWDLDLVAATLFWAPRVKAMFGIPPDGPVSMDDFYAALHPDDREATTAAFSSACDPVQRAPYDVEYRTIGREDGLTRWVSAKGRGIFDDQGRCVRVLGTAIDISARKASEAALHESQQRLRESDRRKDEFLAMLAHELRNPLAPIATSTALLARSLEKPDVVRRASEVIDRQVRHMTELVDDLLDVSRVTKGLIEIDRSPVALKSMVHSALEQARPLLEARGHAVALRLPAAQAWILGDQTRLVQAIANLLNNAAKYTPSGGHVNISLEADAIEARLAIVDDGRGIDAKILPYVFDLFMQAERSPDRSQGGLGIGLALVKTVVELHGGTIHATSRGLGQGSAFTISLPVMAEPEAASDSPSAPLAAGRARRVLITDDNVDAAETLAALLELDGHEVCVAFSAAAAIAQAKLRAFDVCILDIGLPDMTGLELARALRDIPTTRTAVFVAATGYGQASDRAETAAAGFDHHLVKPIEPETVRRLIEAAGVA